MNSEKQSTNLQMTLREVNRVGEGQRNVPKLRFKGYEDAWEQRKLGEEVQIVMGQSPKGENYTDNPEDYILVQGNADMREGKVFPRVWTTQVTKQAYKGDIILSVRAPVGDIGKTDYDVVIGRGVAAVKGNEFFYQLLGKLKQDGYWTKSSTGSTFDSINSNEIKNAKVTIPDANEQLFIGNYFQRIDNLITLHQRKYDALKSMKKTLLSKMFPKNGEDVPEIRFKGFADAWEQRKLGELGKTYTGLSGKTKEDIGHGEASFVTYLNVFNNPMADKEQLELVEIDKKQNEVMKGDIFFTVSSEIPEEVGMASVWPYDMKNVYLNSFCFGYRPIIDINLHYASAMLRSRNIRKRMYLLAQGISRYNISKNKVMEIDVSLPSLKEQSEIGEYFNNIEILITLHQRKLDELKNMKKTLLQQMFV